MRLSTRSRYGTRMLLDIALHAGNGSVRISDVAKRQGVSAKYLEKLVQPLKQANLIESRRGPGGGHTLAKPADEIYVGQVVRLLEGEKALTRCAGTSGGGCAHAATCLARELWTEASEAMFGRLDEITFGDLVKRLQDNPELTLGPCKDGQIGL